MKRLAVLLSLALAACASQPQVPPPAPALPPVVVQQDPPPVAARSITGPADFVLVDKSDRLLVLYRNGRAFRSYGGLAFGDAPMGHKRFQGDERTPEGRYFIDTRNPQSSYHLSLRISYPDSSDRDFAAQHGRSPGGDIFIHGQPNGMAGADDGARIGGDWTDGCIAVSNAEIEELWDLVPDGTPIEIRR